MTLHLKQLFDVRQLTNSNHFVAKAQSEQISWHAASQKVCVSRFRHIKTPNANVFFGPHMSTRASQP